MFKNENEDKNTINSKIVQTARKQRIAVNVNEAKQKDIMKNFLIFIMHFQII